MAEVASAYVSLLPSAKGFGSKLDGEISGDIKSTGKRAGATFGKMFALGGGLLAAAGIGGFLKDSLGEAREAQKVGALTESIIKSTGGAAKVTAKQVGDLAGAISLKTGMDDEAIQSGANMLLTFKNVRNEVGKGSDIFNRATQAATDLSAAGFGDLTGQSKMLGKALNDPIKGMSALGRSGVTFTADQQALVKSLVEGGDVLKAQKIILGEVESQVGGAAEASATAGEKAAVAFGNIKEELGAKLLPVVDKVLNLFLDKGVPAISNFMDTLGKGSPIIQRVAGFVRNNLLPPIQDLAGWVMNSLVPAIQNFARDALPGVQSALGSVRNGLKSAKPFFELLGNIVTEVLLPVLGKLARTILPLVGDAVEKVGEGFGILGKLGTALWNKALQPAFKFILGGIGSILDMWSSMLRTLAKVPGFGWAAKAADAMANAADKARDVAAGIQKIPTSKTVNITVAYKYTGLKSPTRGRDDEFGINPQGRASNGPQRAFNQVLKDYGKTGQELMARIAKGIKTAQPKTVKAAQEAFEKLKSKIEFKKGEIESDIDTLVDKFSGIRESVANAFAGNLFDVGATEAKDAVYEVVNGLRVLKEPAVEARTIGQNFIAGLTAKRTELTGLLSSFNVLKGWGIDPKFLTQLFASGQGALITELAGMGQAGAVDTANLFGEVTSLGNQLGGAVAANDPVAAEMATANATLVEIRDALSYLGGDIGRELNAAAATANRDKKKRGKK